MKLDAAGLHYRELNQHIREAVAAGATAVEVVNVNGQRYLGDGIRGKVDLTIHGVPGNDLGAFMDGPTIRICGNAQDGVANTMNSGRIIVEGDAGDVLGYGMRGGELFVRGRIGYRVGIHMKAYKEHRPVIIAGGTAGDFLCEYMAGGLAIVLGLERWPGEPLIGEWCATGMHGGALYLRGPVEAWRIAQRSAGLAEASAEELAGIRPHLASFCKVFELDLDRVMEAPFYLVAPVSHRPYAAKYAA